MADYNFTDFNQYSDEVNAGREVTMDSFSTGKKEEVGNKNFPSGVNSKVLSYPLSRRNTSDTDYLEMKIFDYEAPGLNLGGISFGKQDLNNKDRNDKNEQALDASNITIDKGSFALRTGSDVNRQIAMDPKSDEYKKKLKHIVYLPMPRNVTDTQGVQYGEGSLNPIEAFGLAMTSNLLTGNVDQLKKAFQTITNKTTQFTESDQQAIAASLSGTAIGALGGNVNANQLIARATGQVLNPNLELLFQGVGLRVFPFQFQFFPRNRDEAQMVMAIIRVLKFEMAPSRTTKESNLDGIFIRKPSVFHLRYMQGDGSHKFLHKFLPAVLSDMKVNYSASGAYSSFYDGTPTHIQVNLQFKELNPIFKEDYDGVDGVGY